MGSSEARGPDTSLTPAERGLPRSAPAEVGSPRRQISLKATKHSLDQQLLNRPTALGDGGFELDPTAPIRAMRSQSSESQEQSGGSNTRSLLQSVAEEEEKEEDGAPSGGKGGSVEREETWGESFKVGWLCTQKLPFNRTRHLRNPWNHDREVKVSRDGTELEPTVGQRLLEEWTRLTGVQPVAVPGKVTGPSKSGPKLGPQTPVGT